MMKILSYNTGSRSDLGVVRQLMDMHNPSIVFLQEVKLRKSQVEALLGSEWKAEVSLDPTDPRKPGIATAWRSDMEDVEIETLVMCRLQRVIWRQIMVLNVYLPSGTNGVKQRREIIEDTMFNAMANERRPRMILGDFNCVTRSADVDGGDATNV